MKIVYTGGTFDILHIGHINLLKQCNTLGEVIVSLNTDEFIKRYKGRKTIYSYDERKQHLLDTGLVKSVIPNTYGEDSKPAILSVKPDFIVVGTDWAQKDYYKQMTFTQDWLNEHRIQLVYVPYYKNISTSDIIKRIK